MSEKLYAKPTDQEETRDLRFIQRALSRDVARPVLNGMVIDREREKVAAADGFRIHETDIPSCLANVDSIEREENKPDTLVKPLNTIAVSPRVEEFEVFAGKFPSYHLIFPDTPPKFQIAVDPKLLKDALEIPNEGMVILSFWKNTGPFMVTGNDQDGPRALLMPMHAEGLANMP